MNYTFILIIILVIGYFIYMRSKFPKGLPTGKWDMNDPQARAMAEKLFRLMPGENILHQTSGFVDVNSFVEKNTARDVFLAAGGRKLRDPIAMTLVLTDRGRFIVAPFDHRIDPLIFDQHSLPKVVDTGRVGRFSKLSWLDTQEGRILEFQSDLIVEYPYNHENSENMELTVPNDFIPYVLDWAKKDKDSDEYTF